jgi:sulfotransferase family protein
LAATKRHLDFIVIGAQKAGTTSLFEYLRRHPQLALPAGKEVPYFSHDARYGGDWDEYLGKAFAFAQAESKWGTVTPHYMTGGIYEGSSPGPPPPSDEHTVPLRIRERLPGVRLVALIRDPVERARSHHAMAVMNGWDRRDFATAARELLSPEALEAARRVARETTGYVVWGEYGRILRGYLDVFPREQLLVLYTAELRSDPAAVVRRVYEFLEVNPGFVPDNLGTTYRPSGSTRRLHWLDLTRLQEKVAASTAARTLWRSLPEGSRRRVDQVFDRVNYRAQLWNRRSGERPATSGEDDIDDALRAHYEEDARRLQSLLGTSPPWA